MTTFFVRTVASPMVTASMCPTILFIFLSCPRVDGWQVVVGSRIPVVVITVVVIVIAVIVVIQ